MQAQAQHPVSSLVLRLALTATLLAAVSACEPPSPERFEPGNSGLSGDGYRSEAAPRPSGVPEGNFGPPDVGATSPDLTGEGPISESAGRPSGVPEGELRPPDVGTTSPGFTGSEPYDCNRTGLHLAQVNLASIKAFMDNAYRDFVENERSGERGLAQEKYTAYVTAKADLDLKRWRCFNCLGEIGCTD